MATYGTNNALIGPRIDLVLMGKFIPGLVKQIHFFPERDDETLEIVQILTTQNFEKY